MAYYTSRSGWNVETTHPTVEPNGNVPVCSSCADAIDPTINFAADWGSTAHQHSFTDGNGDTHVIVVRVPEPEPEP